MTWTASLLPDDALPPDSLVGRMLNVKPTSNLDQIRSSELRPEPLAEVEQFLGEYADDFKALAASERADLPLWRVMQEAGEDAWLESNYQKGQAQAAQIEALRDWLLPEAPEPQPEDGRYEQRHTILQRDNKLRAQLTEQARIARGD